MKRIISFIVVAISSIVLAQAQAKLSANEILKEAGEKAAKENKKVFVMFHASWCGWCHRMDASMNDEDVKKYFDDNFIVRHFVVDESADKKDLETPGANEIRTKYHGDGQGIPYWLVFDSKGNMLADSKMRKEGEGPEKGQNTGCPAAEAEVAYFIDVLKSTTKLKEDQLEKISKRFRKNEN
jgi:thiol-disulfide isomerase/thioredoxin